MVVNILSNNEWIQGKTVTTVKTSEISQHGTHCLINLKSEFFLWCPYVMPVFCFKDIFEGLKLQCNSPSYERYQNYLKLMPKICGEFTIYLLYFGNFGLLYIVLGACSTPVIHTIHAHNLTHLSCRCIMRAYTVPERRTSWRYGGKLSNSWFGGLSCICLVSIHSVGNILHSGDALPSATNWTPIKLSFTCEVNQYWMIFCANACISDRILLKERLIHFETPRR